VLTVADDGPGIPDTLRPEIFERFARGDSSRSRRGAAPAATSSVGGSTGLGLAIVAAVVKAHHGTIAVDSRPGGTAFAVTLPVGSQTTHSAVKSNA
jgi:two-component system OmpR family sensor kinase